MADRTELNFTTLSRAGFRYMTQDQAERALREIYNALELLVGERLTKGLTPGQLAAIDRHIESKDDSAAFNWLNSTIKDLQNQVQQEFEYVERRLAAAAQARSEELAKVAEGEVAP